jgi:hypothetical protein
MKKYHLGIFLTWCVDHLFYSVLQGLLKWGLLYSSRIRNVCAGQGREREEIWFLLETGYCCVAQAGLKLSILLLWPPKCWDYRHVLVQLAWFCIFNKT